MAMPIDHLRVGQAWTAYVAPIIVTLFVGLAGVAMLVSGLFAASAAASPDPAPAIAQVVPMPTAAGGKSSHRKVHGGAVENGTPAAMSPDDRQRIQDGSHRFASGGVVLLLLAAAYMTYRAMAIRSRVLFTDDTGVWLRQGILPWSHGTRGVKWRDLEGALVFTGFKSWLLRSSTVRVSHRFTKDSEIIVSHVPRGAAVVGQINEIHRRLLVDPAGHLGIDAPR